MPAIIAKTVDVIMNKSTVDQQVQDKKTQEERKQELFDNMLQLINAVVMLAAIYYAYRTCNFRMYDAIFSMFVSHVFILYRFIRPCLPNTTLFGWLI